ncbi:hypothetical protein NEOC95_000097 [Neochlamydia sp. AcF95]|nr:hypothetical protein [Neochlamydia sp. AcF95]
MNFNVFYIKLTLVIQEERIAHRPAYPSSFAKDNKHIAYQKLT